MSFPAPTERQAKLIWIALSGLASLVVVALLGLIFLGAGIILDKLAGVIMPMATAVILAYVLEPVVQFFEQKKITRFHSVLLVYALALLILVGAGGFLLPGLVRQSRSMAAELPKSIAKLRVKADKYLDKNASWVKFADGFISHPVSTNATNAAAQPGSTNRMQESGLNSPSSPSVPAPSEEEIASHSEGQITTNTAASQAMPELEGVQNVLLKIVQGFGAQLGKVTTLAEFVIGFVLVPVYLFYFLLEKDSIVKHWQLYVPIKHEVTRREVIFVLQSINDCMMVFFRGQVLVAMCVGALLAIGYTVMGLKYSILLGVVAGLIGIVPYLGTVVSLALALVVAGTQFGDWFHPLLVLAIAGSVKLVEDLVISPKIVGERAGLHPLATIVAVLVGSTLLGGFLGALLAIPLTATLRVVMNRYVWNPAAKVDEHPLVDAPKE